jgi:hypothetical protein
MDAERVMVGKKPKVLYEYTVLRDSGFGKTCLFCVRGLDFLNTPVVPAQAATPFPKQTALVRFRHTRRLLPKNEIMVVRSATAIR